jgi:hypothetical protein
MSNHLFISIATAIFPSQFASLFIPNLSGSRHPKLKISVHQTLLDKGEVATIFERIVSVLLCPAVFK